jgi:hypothetical protein
MIFIPEGKRLGILGFATGDEDTQHNDKEDTGDDTDDGCDRHVLFLLE